MWNAQNKGSYTQIQIICHASSESVSLVQLINPPAMFQKFESFYLIG